MTVKSDKAKILELLVELGVPFETEVDVVDDLLNYSSEEVKRIISEIREVSQPTI